MLAIALHSCCDKDEDTLVTPDDEQTTDETKERIVLEETETTLHFGDTYQIEFECDEYIKINSDNEKTAFVDDQGMITAGIIGESTITLSVKGFEVLFTITVEPVYTDVWAGEMPLIGDSFQHIVDRYGPDIIQNANYDETNGTGFLSYDSKTLGQGHNAKYSFMDHKVYEMSFNIPSDQYETYKGYFTERYETQEENGTVTYLNYAENIRINIYSNPKSTTKRVTYSAL